MGYLGFFLTIIAHKTSSFTTSWLLELRSVLLLLHLLLNYLVYSFVYVPTFSLSSLFIPPSISIFLSEIIFLLPKNTSFSICFSVGLLVTNSFTYYICQKMSLFCQHFSYFIIWKINNNNSTLSQLSYHWNVRCRTVVDPKQYITLSCSYYSVFGIGSQ